MAFPGDFSLDGVVDAADYTVWRNNLGAPYTLDHYGVWKTNYGMSIYSGESGLGRLPHSVPEPTFASLLFLLLAASLGQLRRLRCVE